MAYLRFTADYGTAIIHNQVAYKKSNGQPSLGVIDTYWGVNDTSWSSQSFHFAEPGGRQTWTDQQMAVANLAVHKSGPLGPYAINDATVKTIYTAPTNGTFRLYRGTDSDGDQNFACYDHSFYINSVWAKYWYVGGVGSIRTPEYSIPINVNTGDVIGFTHNSGSWDVPFMVFFGIFLPNTYPY